VRAIVDDCCEDVNEVGDVDEVVVDGCGGGRLKWVCDYSIYSVSIASHTRNKI
jgi:hypothetical protein